MKKTSSAVSNKSVKKTTSFKARGPITVQLAKKWEQAKHDPVGWLMSEKLDGVRMYWDGANMYSRTGLKFYPPDWFKDILPNDIALDGELWSSRDDFQQAVGIIKRKKNVDSEAWKKISYMVYDAPLIKGPFSERLDVLAKSLSSSRSALAKKHVILHKQEVCKSQEQLDTEMTRVIDIMGEGLMLKDPNSVYEQKRSDKLLKVKKFDDAEAEVIGHEEGTGRL